MSRTAPTSGPTAVYRLWDADGQLLYVGCSHDPRARYVEHERLQPWWPAVDRYEEIWCDTRKEAEAAERIAIGAEQPAYNSTDADGRYQVPRARVSEKEAAEARRVVRARLEADLRLGRYPQHRFLPTPVELGREYGHAARDIVAALDELQGHDLVLRVHSNRYVPAAPGRSRKETARGLMLQEVIDSLGTGPFSRKDIRTLTGRSAGVVDRYVADLVTEGRLEPVGLRRPQEGGRAVEHYVVGARDLRLPNGSG